jgi:hypothetical protein
MAGAPTKPAKIQFLIDPKIKEQSEKLVEKKGLTISDALRIFLSSLVNGDFEIGIIDKKSDQATAGKPSK